MKIILSPHLKIRLKERQIPNDYPELIVSKPEILYYDVITRHQIAIKKLKYGSKARPIVVAHDIIDTEIQVVTIYPTDESDIKSKLRTGRWIKNED